MLMHSSREAHSHMSVYDHKAGLGTCHPVDLLFSVPTVSTAEEEGQFQVGALKLSHGYLAAPSSVVAGSVPLYPMIPLCWLQLLCLWLCDQGQTSLWLLPRLDSPHWGHEEHWRDLGNEGHSGKTLTSELCF